MRHQWFCSDFYRELINQQGSTDQHTQTYIRQENQPIQAHSTNKRGMLIVPESFANKFETIAEKMPYPSFVPTQKLDLFKSVVTMVEEPGPERGIEGVVCVY